MRAGENTLRVTVDNSLEPNCRWYTGSGIYRPVHLMVKPKDGVRPVKIRTVSIAPAVVEVQTETEHAAVEIWDGAQCVAKGAPGVIEIPQAKLWDAEHPNLYTCVVKTENDEESVPFGIRTLTWSAKPVCASTARRSSCAVGVSTTTMAFWAPAALPMPRNAASAL